MEFLINMLRHYSNNPKIVELIAECLANNDKSHNKLVEFLKSNNFENDKFQGYMYEIDSFGNKRWKNKEGKFHRTCIAEEDVTIKGTHITNIIKKGQVLPAVIWNYGTVFWYKEGELHRTCIAEEDVTIKGTDITNIIKKGQVLPAEIWPGGSVKWYKEGVKMSVDDITKECSINKVEIYTKEFSKSIKSVTIEGSVVIVKF